MSETPNQREPDEEHEQPTTEDPVGGEETVEEPPPTEAVDDSAIPEPEEDPAIPEPAEDPAIPERSTPDPDTYTEGLVSGPIDPPPRVTADFPVVFRGYDREVVDAHLAALEEDVAELHATRTPQSASRRIDKDTDDVWADRRKLLDDARAMGEALIRLADEALERFPPAEDGGPPVEPPPPVPRRPARPTPAPPRLVEVPRPADEDARAPDEDARAPDEGDSVLEDGGRVLDEGDPSIESVRRIPRPGAPTHPRRPRR